MYKEKNTQKNTLFPPQKRDPSWSLTHPPTSEFFSKFFDFFQLDKTPKVMLLIYELDAYASSWLGSATLSHMQRATMTIFRNLR